MIKINMTESQVRNIIEFFDLNFIASIREDEEIDNIEYIYDMCEFYMQLKGALEVIENV